MLKSNPSRYGAAPVTIHWLTAILILIALLLAHVCAALSHHLIRHDGLLWRMWYGR